VTRFLRISTLTALLALGLAATAGAEPRTFVFDKTHSEVGFNVRHFFNKTHGRFEDYDGQLTFDPANITASSVQVTIKDTSIYTANPRRDAHLRTQDFFWSEKYPTITFKSTKVIPGKDDKHFQVAGDLTIRDVTKPVTLDVEYFGMGPVSIGGHAMGTQAGFMATTTVNRKDYGIIWNKTLDDGGVMLGDDVDIVLSIAAITPERPPAQPASATTPTTRK
jgi:polyisoprenoid-binding protein YceI